MTDVRSLIADMVRSGVDPELIGRTAEALSHREAVLVPDESAERRRTKDRERKALRKSAEVSGNAEQPSPKEAPPAPPEEITPSVPSTQKENPLRGQKKGSRLPSDFVPDIEVAVGLGLSRTEAEHQAAVFIDFWTAKAGADAVKLDWPATWRNWARRAARDGPPRQRAGPKPNAALRADMDAMLSMLGEIEARPSIPLLDVPAPVAAARLTRREIKRALRRYAYLGAAA